MSIARMKKLSVIGHGAVKSALMKELMALGVVEISSPEDKLAVEGEWKELVIRDGNEGSVARYDNWINKVNTALSAIEKYGTGKKDLFHVRKQIRRDDYEAAMKDRLKIEKSVEAVVVLSNKIGRIQSGQNKIETQRLALLPWKEMDMPLSVQETEKTVFLTGTLPPAAEPERLGAALEETTPYCVFEVVNKDPEQH